MSWKINNRKAALEQAIIDKPSPAVESSSPLIKSDSDILAETQEHSLKRTDSFKQEVSSEKKSPLQMPVLSISGIFLSDGQYLALIDNRVVKSGDSVKGVMVEKINFDGVDVNFRGSTSHLDFP